MAITIPVSNKISDAIDHVRNTTPLHFRPSNNSAEYYLIEKRQHRLVVFGKREDEYYLPIPDIAYRFQYFPAFNTHYLWGIYFMRPSIHSSKGGWPCLPNFDKYHPCTNAHDQDPSSPHNVISNFWAETFNYEGKLSQVYSWRYLAHQAKCSVRNRKEVLRYWETLSLDSIEKTIQTYLKDYLY